MTLRKKTINGIIWNFAEQMARKGIGVVITLLLARFLTPTDYGLVSMMAVFLAIAQSLMDSGFKQALIRLQDAKQIDFNTAFYANLGLGVISYLFLSAPLIALFYEEPRLILLVRVAGINIFIQSFQVVQSASLNRQLNFKVQLQATVPAGIISGLTAIILAYLSFSVWALIIQMLLASLITTALLWYIQGWRPSRGGAWQSFVSMYNFGYKLFLSNLLNTIFVNIYVVVIAKIFAASVAGYYFFAKKMGELVISQLVQSIETVTYPALATLQNDDLKLKEGFRKLIRVTTFIVFPSLLLLAALSEPLFEVLLPVKWSAADLYFQLICLAGVMFPLHSINLNILKVKGRSDLLFYIEIIKKTMAVIILFMSYRYGVIGILIGQIIGSILSYFPNSYFSAKLINYTVTEQFSDFMPGLALAGSAALMIYSAGYFVQWPAFARLMVFSSSAVAIFLGGAHLFRLQAYLMTTQIVMGRMNRG